MADDYKIRDKSLEKLNSSVQEAENTIESSSEDSWKCTHQSRCDDSEIFQETGCSKEQEATVENTTLYSISEPRASRTPYSVNSVKAETEHPRQQGGNENPTSVQPKEVVSITVENGNHDSLEKTSPSRSEETYDEITKSEVTSLDDWEDVQQSCLFETPPVDPEALRELELRANDIAGNLDRLLTSLGNSLKAMSHVSTECLSAYSACVDHMSETVDVNIKAMYTLIARCEELNASLKPVQNMAEQIKDIKKTLEIFEALCK